MRFRVVSVGFMVCVGRDGGQRGGTSELRAMEHGVVMRSSFLLLTTESNQEGTRPDTSGHGALLSSLPASPPATDTKVLFPGLSKCRKRP
jgi:hypothetical protein